ncbi:MAG: AzlD domain-containing protein [Dehalococcoidia bacterium]
MNLWIIVIGMGLVTYAIRLSMLVFVHHSTLPAFARDALRYVTPAALTAIILPAVLYIGEQETFDATFGNERLLAAVLAAAVARLTSNTWLTIGAGMSALWALEALT